MGLKYIEYHMKTSHQIGRFFPLIVFDLMALKISKISTCTNFTHKYLDTQPP